MDEVWPLIVEKRPDSQFLIIGRDPPEALVAAAKKRDLAWDFTGFVDDIRDHLPGALAYVIPLRVGGGTRIKAYEAMAMGIPVVSTGLGVEGLPVEPGAHFLRADDAPAFADAVIRLLETPDLRSSLSRSARALVEANYGAEKVADVFEKICLETLSRAAGQIG
jgi:glycosyltransferase involved in cell wall biosynthesis